MITGLRISIVVNKISYSGEWDKPTKHRKEKFMKLGVGKHFAIPLPNDKYAFGYISYEGICLFANIFNFIGNNLNALTEAQECDLLIRDLLMDWSVFINAKNKDCEPWIKLKSQHSNPLEPKHHYIINGGGKVINIFDSKDQRWAEDEDYEKYNESEVEFSDYYTFYIQGLFEGKVVYYNDETDRYELVNP